MHKTMTALIAGLLATTALPAMAVEYFNRVSSFPVALNVPEGETPEENSSEIIAATEDGMMLVYSNALLGGVGFVDIADVRAPKAGGFLKLEGSPTSVTVIGGKALVAVDTTEDFTAPAGYLAIVDIAGKTVESTCDLGGQPDSIAKTADASRIAIVIENQRNEDLNDGEIPQLPSGNVSFLDVVDGVPACDSLRVTELAGLADIAGEDAEPEFIDFNSLGELVVTLQENNWIAVIAGESGEVVNSFTAGSVDLAGIDTEDDGRLSFTQSAEGVLREPDTVQWLDDDRFATSNEGDYNGGSRGWTIYNKDGTVAWESGPSMEMIAASLGHYPDGRSDAKGVEPEGMEVATFGETRYVFVAQERSSLVAIYKDTGAEPEYVQSIPSGIGPEGALAIPARNLFITANETDLSADGLAGAHVMIFELGEAERPAYPQLVADLDAEGKPFGWAAISGAVADAERPGMLYAVSDSVLGSAPAIYEIDATASPARIVNKTLITRNGEVAQKLDLEGITLDGDGGFWVASEGDSAELIPHALYRVSAGGEIEEEVPFPAGLRAHETRSGSEGIAAVGEGDDLTLWVAIQREWGDDEAGFVKLVSYKPESEEWGAVRYPLDAKTTGWVGLSEITAHGDHVYLIERDNLIGDAAVLKKVYRVPVGDLVPAEIGGELPLVTKEEVRDLIPDLRALNGYVVDKVESLAIDTAGEGFVITDNDGVDDSSGETYFFSIGTL